ncbi:MAG TPA: hypothetical protein VF605_15270 [Allosphingosinicella sp.]|jgi:hypothetical protein
MPDFDTGNLFYTGLFPVDLRPTRRVDKSITSHSHLLREVLASLPNYSPEDRAALPSPFSRDSRTHFARFAIIDDPAFEGRISGDALVAAARSVDPSKHQPVDHLSRSWLIFVADADAREAGDSCRDTWARGLWEVMEPELRAVFRHCLGFRKVETGEDFAAYLAKGQVETTMSFHDYWIDPPDLPNLSLSRIKWTILLPALVGALAVAWWRWQPWHWPSWPLDWGGMALVLLGALVGLAVGLWLIVRTISGRGGKSWPAGADSDLPSVLKSLHVQREFTRFAVANQVAAPADLHAAFGRFIAEVKPDDVAGPTQKAGVVP